MKSKKLTAPIFEHNASSEIPSLAKRPSTNNRPDSQAIPLVVR